MFNSTVLDVAVGVIFVFFVVSLAASAILEAIAGITTWRNRTLLKSIKDLLNDQSFTGLAKELYSHALINPRGNGKIEGDPSTKWLRNDKIPAYIDPTKFADALLEIVGVGLPSAAAAAGSGATVAGNARSSTVTVDNQIDELLKGMERRAGNDLEKMRTEIATWFDNAMDRVSGVYKRWTQLWHFFIALALAAALNISTINVASHLWKQPNAAKVIENNKEIKGNEAAVAALRQLDSLALPIGWSHYHQPPEKKTDGSGTQPSDTSSWAHWSDVPELFLGWLLTAVAALFGAPFWFDLLQRVIRLKGAGPSPQEKKEKTAAAG